MAKLHYKNYALVLLTAVAVTNLLDRGVLALSMESIKAEFQLSDGQLGLMSGFAFALFYAVAGVPIARWADRGNRNTVITVTAALWSAMLVLSGWVASFTQLLMVRVGVAVGEAGCFPPAQSLISDYFNRAERPRAMAVYWLCSPIATVLSYVGGGWLIDHLGWRNTFIVIGVSGGVLAFLVKLTLREPRTELNKSIVSEVQKQPPIKEVMALLWKSHAFKHLTIASCVITFFSVGIAVWIPAFFMRSHGMGATDLGIWIGLSTGVGGLIFTYLGGYLAARFAPCREGLQMKCIAFLTALCAVVHIFFCLSDNTTVSLLLMAVVMGGLLPVVIAPELAAIQSLLDTRVRAVALALFFMMTNLIGMGVGPMTVGLVSDLLAPTFGQESLRYALLLFAPGFLWGAFHFWTVSTTIEKEIRSNEAKADLLIAQEADQKPDDSPQVSNNLSTAR